MFWLFVLGSYSQTNALFGPHAGLHLEAAKVSPMLELVGPGDRFGSKSYVLGNVRNLVQEKCGMMYRLASGRTYAVYSVAVVVVIVALGAYDSVQSLRIQGSVSHISSTANSTTVTSVSSPGTQLENSSLASATYAFAPYGLLYLSFEPGCLADGAPAPCFGPLSEAVIFNCAIAAKSSSGCTQEVYINGSSSESYVVTVWYNATLGNSTFGYSSGLSWINCRLSVHPPSGPSIYYAYYIALNSTSFLVSTPIPAPPKTPTTSI